MLVWEIQHVATTPKVGIEQSGKGTPGLRSDSAPL